MKLKNKVLSMLLALIMVLGVFAPGMARAVTTPTGSIDKDNDISKTRPDTTKVNIYKLQADSYKEGAPWDHTGGKITNTQELGTNVKFLNGVTFTYYKVTDEQFKKLNENKATYSTTTAVEGLGIVKEGEVTTAGETGTVPKEDKGEATVSLAEGNYWFVESGKPETVSSAIAVPFGISLPLTNVTKVGDHEPGSVYLKTVHIYPKNITGDEPTPEKTVEDMTNKHATHNVGDEVKWYLHATIPGNIADYEKIWFTDELDGGLTFKGKDSINVKYGTGADFNSLSVELIKDTDYTVDVSGIKSTGGGTFIVKLTDTGMKKLVEKTGTGEGQINKGKLVVEFATTINDKAKVATGVPNEYTLTYNTKGKPDKTPKSDTPKVHLGERKFVKTDGANKIAGDSVENEAHFIVENKKVWTGVEKTSKYLKKADVTGEITWVDSKDDATVFKTNTEATFTVGKLEYSYPIKQEDGTSDKSKPMVNDYALIEIKAPKGYALLKERIAFVIDENSYNEKVGLLEGHTEIKNKKMTIPQTGGIGTAIFTGIGLTLMAGAVIALKRNNKREEE